MHRCLKKAGNVSLIEYIEDRTGWSDNTYWI